MLLCSEIKSRLYAILIAASFVLLQLSLASINPHKLMSTGFESQGVKSYLVAMDINNDTTMATAENNRLRQRTLSQVMIDSILNNVTGTIDYTIFPDAVNVALHKWQNSIGTELEALPKADMVARK